MVLLLSLHPKPQLSDHPCHGLTSDHDIPSLKKGGELLLRYSPPQLRGGVPETKSRAGWCVTFHFTLNLRIQTTPAAAAGRGFPLLKKGGELFCRPFR